jgi:hypothetical protein
VKVAYGSDLLGALLDDQSREFSIRAEVQQPIEVIRAATTIAAEVVRRPASLAWWHRTHGPISSWSTAIRFGTSGSWKGRAGTFWRS